MATTIQLKRGSAKAWQKLNLVLEVGEPGFEKDTNRLIIGDGFTPWNELPYQDQNNENVYDARTKLEFPSVGKSNVLYKASQEAKLYQWNESTMTYTLLSMGPTVEEVLNDIDLISGGNANERD